MKLELKSLSGFPSYSIDTEGNIHSAKRAGGKGGVLKQFYVKGYKRVSLWENGKLVQKQVHRLIAESFIANPEMKEFVNHKNGIKSDNRIDNLEWCTAKENSQHSYDMGLSVSPAKGRFGYDSFRHTVIGQYTKEGEFICEHGSIRSAARDLGIGASSISLCINNKLKSSGGFVWKRA